VLVVKALKQCDYFADQRYKIERQKCRVGQLSVSALVECLSAAQEDRLGRMGIALSQLAMFAKIDFSAVDSCARASRSMHI
jgi:hypothetical protein